MLVVGMLLLVASQVGAQVYEAENQDASYGVDRRVVDPTASGGVAVACDKGVHPGGQYVFATGYFDTPPGRYRATWRLRTDDVTATAPVITLDETAPGDLPYELHVVTLKGTDFAQPNQWQDFVYEFDRLEQGRVQYRGFWPGAANVVLDKLTVEKIADFTEQELYDRVVKQYPLPVPPDLPALWKQSRDDKLQVLELTGVEWQELWQTDQAAPLVPAQMDSKAWTHNWSSTSVPGEYFPNDYATLFKYDVVLLTNGDGRRLTAPGRRMLRDFVQQGGGLVVLGGYQSYGKGRLKGSWLEEVLPVTVGDPWDLRAAESRPVSCPPGTPGLLAMPRTWTPEVLWLHEVTPKPGAQVVWTAGKRPVLVTGKAGAGWVAAVTASDLGQPADESLFFCKSEVWPLMLGRIIRWAGQTACPLG
ncbi:MAG TPA: glutamine amidotransferase [Armatimonadota bacterium]|jgi:uncharacterized membrane protein